MADAKAALRAARMAHESEAASLRAATAVAEAAKAECLRLLDAAREELGALSSSRDTGSARLRQQASDLAQQLQCETAARRAAEALLAQHTELQQTLEQALEALRLQASAHCELACTLS